MATTNRLVVPTKARREGLDGSIGNVESVAHLNSCWSASSLTRQDYTDGGSDRYKTAAIRNCYRRSKIENSRKMRQGPVTTPICATSFNSFER